MADKFYEKYWEGSDGHFGDFPLKWPKLALLLPSRSATILEFGCGKGVLIAEMHKLNPQATYIGLDVSDEGLDGARKNCPWAEFKKIEDGGKLPLESNSIDFVMSSEVVEHVYDTQNAFRELSRVVKNSGEVLITTPFHGLLKNLALVLFGFEKHFNPTGPHIRFFTKRNLIKILEENGFEIKKIDYFGRFFPFSHSIIVLAKKK